MYHDLLHPTGQLATTAQLAAAEPKLPPLRSDGSTLPATAPVATVMVAAAEPKLPPFRGD